MLSRYQIGLLIGLLAALDVAPPIARAATNITPAQVAAALATRAIPVGSSQVLLPAQVPARRQDAPLALVGMDALDATHTKAKLHCVEPSDCLPFYAVLSWRDDSDRDRALRQTNPSPTRSAAPPRPTEPLLVRSGERATLVLEGRNVSIKLQVICLSNGGAGKSVRVTTTDRKHIYRAEVAGPGLLKGSI
jgi:hypothetical protein